MPVFGLAVSAIVLGTRDLYEHTSLRIAGAVFMVPTQDPAKVLYVGTT